MILMCKLSSKDRPFRRITTLQCGLTGEILEAGIETRVTLPPATRKLSIRDLNVYESVLFCLHIYIYLPTLPLEQDMTQGQFYKRTLIGLISLFYFS